MERFSTEESSPPNAQRSSSTLVPDTSRRSEISEIGISELSFPNTYVITDGIDNEVHVQKKPFKTCLLYADSEEIFDELKRRLRESNQFQHLLPANIRTETRYFPPIRLGNITKLTLATKNGNHSRKAFVTTHGDSKEFTMESVKRPSDILKGISEEDWKTQTLPSIPIFDYTIFMNNHVKCEATFQILVKSDNDPETILEYVTYVDNNHTKHKDHLGSAINGSHITQDQRDSIIKDMEDMDTVIAKLAEAGVLDEDESINLCDPNIDKSDRIGELIAILQLRWHGLQPLINVLKETKSEKNRKLAASLT